MYGTECYAFNKIYDKKNVSNRNKYVKAILQMYGVTRLDRFSNKYNIII